MEFEQFLDNILKFIGNQIKDEMSQDHLFEAIISSQKYLLNELVHLKIKENNDTSLTYEKIAELINFIEDIVEYEFNKKFLGHDFAKLNHIFINDFDFTLIDNILEDIKTQKTCKSNYLVDSKNTIRDLKYKETFEQYVHATSNCDTQSGQGKLLFNVNMLSHKHIYILNSIIKLGYQGKLITTNEKIKIINLLPFMSMLSKITQNGSKKTIHENLIYLFKTPLIIIGDDIWKEYNKQMKNIYSLHDIEEYEWFYSEHFIKNQDNIIFKNLIIFLKKYVMDVIGLIKIEFINNNLQNNEKLILQQIYNLIKSIIFFEKESNLTDLEFIEQTNYLIEKIEIFNSEYSDLNIKFFKQISYKRVYEDIENEEPELLCLIELLRSKMSYEINHLSKSELNFHNFVLELGKAFSFSEKFFYYINKCKHKTFNEIFKVEKFQHIINKESFKDKSKTLSVLYELIFYSFPTFGKRIAQTKFKNKQEKEDLYLIFFLVMGCLPLNKEFFINFDQKVESAFAGDYSYIEQFKTFDIQLIFLISELLFPQNKLKFDIKEELKIKEVIYKYTCYFQLNNFSKNYITNINYHNFITEKKHIAFDNLFRENDLIFQITIDFFNKQQYIPVEYAQLLIECLSPYVVVKLVHYLEKINDNSYLKESLLWFLSNKRLEMELQIS